MIIKSTTYQRKQKRYSEKRLFEEKFERYFTVDGIWYCYRYRIFFGDAIRTTLTLEEVNKLPKFILLEADDEMQNSLRCKIKTGFHIKFGKLTSAPKFVTETRLVKAYEKYQKESEKYLNNSFAFECKQTAVAFNIPFDVLLTFNGNLAQGMQFYNALKRAKALMPAETRTMQFLENKVEQIFAQYNIPTFFIETELLYNFVYEFLCDHTAA